uniref:Tail completion protein n=1 Tax=Siphoviridae sp. ctksc2 TaxID=2825645 RepID=A0A8S5URN0_9CAUD|nr:MAG TPA: tail completion protein [Siphoviridae sp. ctksc2]
MAGTSRDTKALVMAALAAALPSTEVVSTVPYANGDPPDPLVLVIATGGQGQHHRVLSTGQVTIDSFAPTTGQAMRLALRVDAVINALVAGHDWPVTKVTGNAPAESPDPTITAARATATYQITTRNQP